MKAKITDLQVAPFHSVHTLHHQHHEHHQTPSKQHTLQ